MQRSVPRRLGLLALLALSLAACTSTARPVDSLAPVAQPTAVGTTAEPGITPTTIQLGGTIALSGPAAAYGTIARAADAYFRYVNDQGGVHGRQIKYTYLDDAYNPAQTVPLTRQQVEQDGVFLMYGGLGTQAQTAVRDYLNSRKVPQVFVATGATTFAAEYQRYPYTFGWQPVYQGEALLYAQYLLQVAPQARVGVLYQNDDYGQDYLDGLTKGLGEQAATMIVGRQSNDVGAPDLTSQILSLKSAGADTLFLFETPTPAIKAIVSTYQTGWRPTIYLNAVAAPVPYLQAAQKSAGDAAAVNGIISALYLKDSLDPGLADDRGMQLFKQIMARYYPEGKVEDNFNVYGMGTAYSLVDVLQQAGPNPTRQGVLDALNSLNESDNPFVASGIAVKNSATDRYTITQQYLAAYDAAANDYRALGQLLDVRGLIKFP